MDADSFLETVEADHETELSRLASSKVLFVLTGGAMDADAVFAAMTSRATAAAETFDEWAGDSADENAAAVFESSADTLRADAEAIEAAANEAGVELESARSELPPPGPMFDRLADLESTRDRAAGLAAWSLIEDGARSQAVGFFVGRADTTAADRFRERRTAVESVRADALDRLAATATDDWDRAQEAASAIIDAAYGHYVDVLEGMGIKVKPVC